MALKETYHKIDASMIIMLTAQVISQSAMSVAEQQAALLRVLVAVGRRSSHMSRCAVVWRQILVESTQETTRARVHTHLFTCDSNISTLQARTAHNNT